MIFQPLYLLFQTFALLVGVVIGSFLNVCIQRMPEDRSLLPNSACDSCGTRIAPHDLVPVLSYLWLRGKCRHCGTAIGGHIPLIEAFTGLISWLVFARIVPDAAHLDTANLVAWVVYFGFSCLLIIATYVDIRHRIIPDQTSLYAVPFGIGSVALLNYLGYDGWMAIDWRQSVLGALFAGGFFQAVGLLARLFAGRDSLGLGDVKMVAMIGSFVGAFPGVLWVMMAGSMIGSAVGIASLVVQRGRSYMPFGPSLALAALLYLLYGQLLVTSLFPNMAVWNPSLGL